MVVAPAALRGGAEPGLAHAVTVANVGARAIAVAVALGWRGIRAARPLDTIPTPALAVLPTGAGREIARSAFVGDGVAPASERTVTPRAQLILRGSQLKVIAEAAYGMLTCVASNAVLARAFGLEGSDSSEIDEKTRNGRSSGTAKIFRPPLRRRSASLLPEPTTGGHLPYPGSRGQAHRGLLFAPSRPRPNRRRSAPAFPTSRARRAPPRRITPA